MRLNGKVAIITGAASGIGRATAELFAREGAKVALVDWKKPDGEKAAQAIRDSGGDVMFCCADVSRSDAVLQFVEATQQEYGRVDVLFNNAAVQIMARLVETSEDEWDQMHRVNLKGVFLGCKHAIPLMIQQGKGSIINMASVLGFVGDPDLAAYCAFKGGVMALTKAAALTYGPQGVRVNCICPGDVETPLVTAYFEKDPNPARLRAEVSSKYALRRIAAPAEIAEAALFLASDASSFISGSSLVVDGGLTVKCY